MPTDTLGQIGVQQWFSLAAGPIFNGPCATRAIKLFGAPIDYAPRALPGFVPMMRTSLEPAGGR
jgi:hypothetical protein